MSVRMFFGAVATFLLSGCATLMSPQETQMAVKQLVDQVQVATDSISTQTAGTSLPPLQSAELTLSSKAVKTDAGEVSLFISAKGGRTQTDTNSMTLVLVPNPTPLEAFSPGPGKDIADAVVAAVAALKDMKGLTLKSLSVTAALEVVKTAGGGVEVELAGVTLGGTTEKAVTSGHSLKLTFAIAEKKDGS